MGDRLLWNRRDFVQMVGCSSLGVISARTPWLSAVSEENTGAAPRFAYIGYYSNDRAAHEIGVFTVEGERWRPTGVFASDHPSFLTLHPSERFLYAINEVDWCEGLPSGAVEAYA